MKATVAFSDEAVSQIVTADRWWRKYRPLAPELFEQSLDRILLLLSETPDLGVVFRQGRKYLVRRILVSETRYHVYYSYEEAEGEVLIHAVWSAVRKRVPKLP